MKRMLNKVISRTKGENYEIDGSVPNSYLISLLIKKMFQLIHGFYIRIHFKKHFKGKRVFAGRKVKIICKRNIKCGKCVTFDDNVYINALCKNGVTFGNNVSIGKNSVIECTGVLRNLGDQLRIGNGVGFSPYAFISVRGKIDIGDNCIFGPYVKIFSENHNFNDVNQLIRKQGETRQNVKICEDCWIGANVIILPGVTIGKGCVIAAGAVVNKDIPDFSVVGGIPAKIIKTRV